MNNLVLIQLGIVSFNNGGHLIIDSDNAIIGGKPSTDFIFLFYNNFNMLESFGLISHFAMMHKEMKWKKVCRILLFEWLYTRNYWLNHFYKYMSVSNH